MADLRTRTTPRLPRLSQQALKNAAAVLLLLVSAGAVVIERGIIRLDGYTTEGLLAAMEADPDLTGWVGAASILRVLGGLLAPVYALLLVEGFLHTASYRRYLGRMCVTALVSELAYDFAMAGRPPDLSRQSPMAAMVVCLGLLYVLRLPEKLPAVERVILRLLAVLCALFWVTLLRADHGLELVGLAAVLYCFRERDALKLVTGVLVSLLDPIGPLAFCAILFYKGERKLKLPKYAYYVFYPLHLAALGLIAGILRRA